MDLSPTPAAVTLAHAEGRASSLAAGSTPRATIALAPAAEQQLNRLLGLAAGAFGLALAAFVAVPLLF